MSYGCTFFLYKFDSLSGKRHTPVFAYTHHLHNQPQVMLFFCGTYIQQHSNRVTPTDGVAVLLQVVGERHGIQLFYNAHPLYKQRNIMSENLCVLLCLHMFSKVSSKQRRLIFTDRIFIFFFYINTFVSDLLFHAIICMTMPITSSAVSTMVMYALLFCLLYIFLFIYL